MDTVIAPEWREVSPRAGTRDVLVALAVVGPARLDKIHASIREEPRETTRSATQNALQKLVMQGYVIRAPDEDSRKSIYRLSSEGSDLVEQGVLEPARKINES